MISAVVCDQCTPSQQAMQQPDSLDLLQGLMHPTPSAGNHGASKLPTKHAAPTNPTQKPPCCRQGHVMRRSAKKAQVRCSECRSTPPDIFYHCHRCRFTMCRSCASIDTRQSAQQKDDDNNREEEGTMAAIGSCLCEIFCICCNECNICECCDSDKD